MKILSIDIETTGLDINESEILEVGIVAFDSDIPFKTTKDNTLRIVMVKNKWRGETYALNLNKDIIKEILDAQKFFKGSPLKPLHINSEGNYSTVYVNAENTSNYWRSAFSPSFPVGLSHIKESTLDEEISNFLSKNNIEGRVSPAGKNFAGFDAPFLKRNNFFKVLTDRLSHRVIDPGSMYVEASDSKVPWLGLCLERAGFEPIVPHTAVEDAMLVVKVVQAKWKI